MVNAATIEAQEPEAAAQPGGKRSWERPFVACVIAGYLLLGIVAYLPLLPWSNDRLFGTGGDSILATWFFAWIPHSLAHGLNPFFSHAILVPDGVNLAQNTTAPILGLLTVPFSAFLGPIARGNLMEILAMPVSAIAMFLVLRHWRVWSPAAAIAGLVYGFSPFAIGQGLGHVVLAFLPWPPLIASLAAEVLLQIGSARRKAIWLGLILAFQFLSEPEMFVIIILVAAGLLLCSVILSWRLTIERVASVWKPGLLALSVMGLLLAYPIWMELFGPQHYVGTAQPILNPYFNDLLSFIHPGPMQRISVGFRSLAVPLSNASEAGSFIGWPLLLISIALAARSRKSKRMQAAVGFTLCALVLSLGRRLVIEGHVTPVRLPFGVLVHLPLLGNILPSRFSLAMFLGLAGVVAFGLDDMHRRPPRRPLSRIHQRQAFSLATLTFAAIVVSQFPQWPYAYQPAKRLPVDIRTAIPNRHPVAITYPYASPNFPEPQLWQIQENFSFSLLGGYAEHPDVHQRSVGVPNPLNPPGLDLFLEGQEGYNPYLPPRPITPNLIEITRRTLKVYDVRLIIVDRSAPQSAPVVRLFEEVLGPPRVSDSRYLLWASSSGAL